MPTERNPLSKMLLKCDGNAKYTGKKRPTCDSGEGCVACWQKHNQYLDGHRPKMSKDFEEFYHYICKYKRLLQSSGIDPVTYGFVAGIERTIRNGQYRHGLIAFDRTFEQLAEMDRDKPAAKKRRTS
jgi:hypothetical protein